jgi:hypothetical protein
LEVTEIPLKKLPFLKISPFVNIVSWKDREERKQKEYVIFFIIGERPASRLPEKLPAAIRVDKRERGFKMRARE